MLNWLIAPSMYIMYLLGPYNVHSIYYEEFPDSMIAAFNFAHLRVPLFHNQLFDHDDGTVRHRLSHLYGT